VKGGKGGGGGGGMAEDRPFLWASFSPPNASKVPVMMRRIAKQIDVYVFVERDKERERERLEMLPF
jgi:hypothetical protein